MEYFWLTIALIILIIILWKPIKGVLGQLDNRAEGIRKELDEAKRLHEEAKALVAKYERQLQEGESRAQEIVARAEAERQRLEARARVDIEAMVKRRTLQAEERIAQEEARALAEVRARAADLAARATREILTTRLDAAKAGQVMRTAIEEVGRKLA